MRTEQEQGTATSCGIGECHSVTYVEREVPSWCKLFQQKEYLHLVSKPSGISPLERKGSNLAQIT